MRGRKRISFASRSLNGWLISVRTLPRRYHNGSTRQLTAKHAATITPAVASKAPIKVTNRFLDRVMERGLILEIEKFADVPQAEHRQRREHPDEHRAGEVGAPLQRPSDRREPSWRRDPLDQRRGAPPFGEGLGISGGSRGGPAVGGSGGDTATPPTPPPQHPRAKIRC